MILIPTLLQLVTSLGLLEGDGQLADIIRVFFFRFEGRQNFR